MKAGGPKVSEAKYRALFENSSDAILLTIPDGRVLAANPAACELFGRSEEEIVELGRGGVVDQSDPRLPALLEERAEKGKARGELLMIHQDGTKFPGELSSIVFKDDSGQENTCMIIRDLTEPKRMEAEILALNAELEKRVSARTAQLEAANKELETFAHSVSHYLRAPLRAIDGFSRILLEDYASGLDDEAVRMLKIVRDNSRRLDRLITDILALIKVGQVELRLSRIDMRAMAVAMYHETASEEEIASIRFSVSDIPEAVGDPTLLRKVWGALLSNSIKFGRGTGDRAIAVKAEKVGKELRYIVDDNGIGFDQAYSGKLFNLFQRLHGNESYEGTGVGLPIVKRIVERHGGKVGAEGRPGEGALFWFSLSAGGG
jgi:PAS domain S-box-containing protein